MRAWRFRVSWRWRERIRLAWAWLDKSRWPWVTKKRLRIEQETRAAAVRGIEHRYASETAELRASLAPLIDKLIRVRSNVEQYVLEPNPAAHSTARGSDSSLTFQEPFRKRLLDARFRYQLVLDIAPHLVEDALIHGNSAVAIEEISKRAAHEIRRELKTINFARLRSEARS